MTLSDADLARYRHVGHLTVPGVFERQRTDAVVEDILAWGEQFLADLPPAQRAWYVDGGVKARSVLRIIFSPLCLPRFRTRPAWYVNEETQSDEMSTRSVDI